jgi:tripartite-type tricarboxylate transporter receptor subunit TctC
MTARRTIAARAAAIAILLALVAGAACAQATFPAKPIRIILPYAPGGSTSVIARLLSPKLTEVWGQQVIVDNRPGGNTIIGSEALVRSPPDGYTLLLVTSTHTINASVIKTPYDTIRDFAAVSTLARAPYGLVIHPSLPVSNLREFIAFAKARPGQLDYASSGTGTSNHLATELLCMLTGIRMNHIPYKGGGPAIIDLMGGHVQLHMNVPVNLIPNIRSGRVKGLAFTGETRLTALPQIPTFIEAGLPAFDSTNWNGILAPAATPKPIVEKLAADIRKVLDMPDIGEKLIAQGQTAWPSTPDQFSALIRSEVATFAKVVKTTHIKAD